MNHWPPLIAMLVAALAIRWLQSARFGTRLQDIPNQRSLHSAPTPRIGGIGLMAGMLCGWLLLPVAPAWWLLLPLLGLFAVSLLDDLTGLPVGKRLLAQTAAAAVWLAGSGFLSQQGAALSLGVLLLMVWMTNLYNFMDGSDGLAGGMALFGFGACSLAAWWGGEADLAMLGLTLAAAALGFLVHNFPVAKVFMGDAGSIPLGFLAAALGLGGWQQGIWPAWFPVLVFSPFIVDATVTLARRTLRGAKITEAHREHYYQRAIQIGWSHRRVALVEYVLMLGAAASALFALRQGALWVVVPAWVIVYGLLMRAIDAAWATRGAHV